MCVCLLKTTIAFHKVISFCMGVQNNSLSLPLLHSAFGEYNTEQFTPVKVDKEQVSRVLHLLY